METLAGSAPNLSYFRAGTFLRQNLNASALEGMRIIIDGLDEIASASEGSAIDRVLAKLSQIGNPRFILSCREADWQGVMDRIKIKDDYDEYPVTLRLEPLSRENAVDFLSRRFPEISAEVVMRHLESYGIEVLGGNPLTLRMLGEVATEGRGELPTTRVDLFDQACNLLLREDNRRHDWAAHANTGKDELLLACGALSASLILCKAGDAGIFTGAVRHSPDECLHINDVSKLKFGEPSCHAIKTRLFHEDGENRFTHIHKSFGEYLGAKWLAHCVHKGASQHRVLGMLQHDNIVPTSLRGLHAWIAHFSSDLAEHCIAADPYAVLCYGNAEMLPCNHARTLLTSLKEMSKKNPILFRSTSGRQHFASGLMRRELTGEIAEIIQNSAKYHQLAFVLLESLTDAQMIQELTPTLQKILFDVRRSLRERWAALDALSESEIKSKPQRYIRKLLEQEVFESAELALDILAKVGVRDIPDSTVVVTLLAYLFYAKSDFMIVDFPEEFFDAIEEGRLAGLLAMLVERGQKLHLVKHFPGSVFHGLNIDQIGNLLDNIVKRIKSGDQSKQSNQRISELDVAELVRHLVSEVVDSDQDVDLDRLWSWISWLPEDSSYESESAQKLAMAFRNNCELRAAFVTHVLIARGVDDCSHFVRLGFLASLDLAPTEADMIRALRALRTNSINSRIDPVKWRDLLVIGARLHGSSSVLRQTALEVAEDDPVLLSIMDHALTSDKRLEDINVKAIQDQGRSEGDCTMENYRRDLVNDQDGIAAGISGHLRNLAGIYLGYPYRQPGIRLDPDAAPEERVRELVGPDLDESVLSEFMAFLSRGDLPSAKEIAVAHSRDKRLPNEDVIICGAMEAFRRGKSKEIDANNLAAAYMSWRRLPTFSPVAGSVSGNEFQRAIEAALFQRASDWEAHFRARVEPQLEDNRERIRDLGYLANTPCFGDLAGPLAVDWMLTYPDLNYSAQNHILRCMWDHISVDQLKRLAAHRKCNPHPDVRVNRTWMSVEFAVDFGNFRKRIEQAADANPELIWEIRNRVRSNGSMRFDKLSIEQIAFVVESFSAHWRHEHIPSGISMGIRNPWDASEFIKENIRALAMRKSHDATDALRCLIDSQEPDNDDSKNYIKELKCALSLQLRSMSDAEYSTPDIEVVQSVVSNESPQTVKDLQIWFRHRVLDIQRRIRNSDTNRWQAYWRGDRPHCENYCRDRLIEDIRHNLPNSIQVQPESRTPQDGRVDIALTSGKVKKVKLPVEIKGQWHSKIWAAAEKQLAQYARDWQAGGYGTYLALWFGDNVHVRHRAVKPPADLERPTTAEELQHRLVDCLREELRHRVDVIVIDLSKPAK